MKLTAAILTLDEEQMIERALASVAFADEILVVDGGSKDATVAIAKAAGVRVVERPFDDFARQRNFALEQASGDWVLFVDADERVTPALAASIAQVLSSEQVHDAYAIPRTSIALGRELTWHLGGVADEPVRLLRRGVARWTGLVHEQVEGARSTGRLDGALVHLTHRTVSEVVGKIDRYSEHEAAQMVAAGAQPPRARDIMRSFAPALRALWRSGLRKEGVEGAIEAVLLAFNKTLVLAKVWEQTRDEPLAATYRRIDEQLQLPQRRPTGDQDE